MLICQITDFHAVPEAALAYGIVDTRAALRRAIDAILRLETVPDAVLVTGDLADTPDPEVYEFVALELGRLPMPYFIVPGNHDALPLLLEQFAKIPTAGGGFVAYAVDSYQVRLIGLDTTGGDSHLPAFGPDRLAWLEAALAAAPDKPTLIFMHHPPFAAGVDAMDFLGVAWADGLATLIRSHKQVIRVVCGHHHRNMTAGWAGTVVTVAPGVAHQFPPRFDASALPALTLEPPGMLLHWWTGAHLVTHATPIDPAPTREFFAGQPALWVQAKHALRRGDGLPVYQEPK